MAEVTVGSVLVAVLVVVAFGYFIYRRVTAKKKTSGTGGSGSGGGPGDSGSNFNQV